jgi:prepilin signal peptidase PulO-like enzyme (type II secretory pathway)
MLVLMWIDRLQLLPDALTLPGTLVALGIVLPFAAGRVTLLGIAVGSGLLWLLAWGYRACARSRAWEAATSNSPQCLVPCSAGS